MKLPTPRRDDGFTLAEVMVSVGIASLLFAAIFTTATALNRSYAAADNYFATHMQQIRIMDYLARDVKRSFSVTTSPDLKTVTCIMPDYTVRTGDPEAITDVNSVGIRRTPVVVGRINKALVDYGTRNTRTLIDGSVASGALSTLTSATAAFTSADIGNPVTGAGLAAGTKITALVTANQVTLSNPWTVGTGKSFTIYGDGNRTVTDASTTNGSATVTSNTAFFTSVDVGKPVVGTTIPAGTKILSVQSATSATMTANATNPKDPNNVTINPFAFTMTIGGTTVIYSVVGNTITRSENGTVTMIASSTDSLLPQTTDWQQSNTEFTTTTVTFQPIFTMNGTAAQRSGTTVYATAYLRNKRRGN